MDPGDIRRKMYASLKADLQDGFTRLMGSLDLSSFSTGMPWDMQQMTNEVLARAYDGGEDMFAGLESCTINSYMVRSQDDVRLPSKNVGGANYEGVDGKRNTLMHCVLWYLARADASEAGVSQPMKGFIFIDDGAFVMELPSSQLDRTVMVLKRSLVATYTRHGFKLSALKTIFSETYVQFLNEVYFHGVHVGYGFRALCHTGSQVFPLLSTVAEELAVISSGVRGAAVAGGHPVRLMVGYHFILSLYMEGVIGNKGRSLACARGEIPALCFALPTCAGGFGLPNCTAMFNNLSGNRETEKLDRVRKISRFVRAKLPLNNDRFREFLKHEMLAMTTITADAIPDRMTMSMPSSKKISAGSRAKLVAEAAMTIAVNPEARVLLKRYLDGMSKVSSGTFAHAFVEVVRSIDVKWPVVVLEKGLATDPNSAMALLVDKIATSDKVSKLLTAQVVRKLNATYYADGMRTMRTLAKVVFGI